MEVYDYNKKELLEVKQYSQRSLKFLYKTIPGRASLKVVTRPTVAKIYGRYNDSKFSKRKIDAIKSEKVLEEACENGTVLEYKGKAEKLMEKIFAIKEKVPKKK